MCNEIHSELVSFCRILARKNFTKKHFKNKKSKPTLVLLVAWAYSTMKHYIGIIVQYKKEATVTSFCCFLWKNPDAWLAINTKDCYYSHQSNNKWEVNEHLSQVTKQLMEASVPWCHCGLELTFEWSPHSSTLLHPGLPLPLAMSGASNSLQACFSLQLGASKAYRQLPQPTGLCKLNAAQFTKDSADIAHKSMRAKPSPLMSCFKYVLEY